MQERWSAVDRYLTEVVVQPGPAMLAADPRLSATVIQTVGGKGYDGLTVALVVGHAPR
jgi:hypothetical protein